MGSCAEAQSEGVSRYAGAHDSVRRLLDLSVPSPRGRGGPEVTVDFVGCLFSLQHCENRRGLSEIGLKSTQETNLNPLGREAIAASTKRDLVGTWSIRAPNCDQREDSSERA